MLNLQVLMPSMNCVDIGPSLAGVIPDWCEAPVDYLGGTYEKKKILFLLILRMKSMII